MVVWMNIHKPMVCNGLQHSWDFQYRFLNRSKKCDINHAFYDLFKRLFRRRCSGLRIIFSFKSFISLLQLLWHFLPIQYKQRRRKYVEKHSLTQQKRKREKKLQNRSANSKHAARGSSEEVKYMKDFEQQKNDFHYFIKNICSLIDIAYVKCSTEH